VLNEADFIHNDPLVQALLNQFPSARIVPGSVRTVIEEPAELESEATDARISTFAPSYSLLRSLQRDPGILENLNWRQFEKLIATLLERDGYAIELTRGSRDGGVDVIAIKNLGANGWFKAVWQAKKTGVSRKVGISVVRELADTRNEFGASKGIIVTSAFLTSGALKRIEQDRYLLGKIDRNDLHAWVQRTAPDASDG